MRVLSTYTFIFLLIAIVVLLWWDMLVGELPMSVGGAVDHSLSLLHNKHGSLDHWRTHEDGCWRRYSSICQRIPHLYMSNGVTLSDLEAALSRGVAVRIQIVNQMAYIDAKHAKFFDGWYKFRINSLALHLQHLLIKYTVPDVDFVVSLLDAPPEGAAFGYGRRDPEKGGFMCPSYQFWDRDSLFGGMNRDNWRKTATYTRPMVNFWFALRRGWSGRSPVAFWRGSCTDRKQRAQLVNISVQHPGE
jgi:hypothetical protein